MEQKEYTSSAFEFTLPSHKEPVKKTAPTYVRSIMMPFCSFTVITYRDNLVKIWWNIVIMLFLLSHRPSTDDVQLNKGRIHHS